MTWKDKTAQLRRDLIKHGGCQMTLAQFREWLESRRVGNGVFKCAYCRAFMLDTEISIDHKDPVTLGGTASAANLCVCCRDCNIRKADLGENQYCELLEMVQFWPVPMMTSLLRRLAQRPVWKQWKRISGGQ